MKKKGAGSIGLVILLCGACSSTVAVGLKDEADRINYSVGYQVGGDFRAQGVEVRPEAAQKGMRDAVENIPPLMTKTEMDSTLIALKKRIVSEQRSRESKAGVAFLAENARQKDITVLPSGIQYKVLQPGTGKKPTLKDEVKVHYRISKLDGKEIGSTYVGGKPRWLAVSNALPGLQEVLQLMAEGAKWQVAFPTATAAAGREPMEDMGVLIYEIELLSVKSGVAEAGKPDAGELQQKP